jgi:hypothetical protein
MVCTTLFSSAPCTPGTGCGFSVFQFGWPAYRPQAAGSARLWARRASSISSELANVIASLLDAMIVYKWLLQSMSGGMTSAILSGAVLRHLVGVDSRWLHLEGKSRHAYKFVLVPQCPVGASSR